VIAANGPGIVERHTKAMAQWLGHSARPVGSDAGAGVVDAQFSPDLIAPLGIPTLSH
jgi:hypothetical protein